MTAKAPAGLELLERAAPNGSAAGGIGPQDFLLPPTVFYSYLPLIYATVPK